MTSTAWASLGSSPGTALYTAAQALATRIRELGLRTVRLIVVDQHGVPRGKALAPDVAIAAMANGLDFPGAIYSLDSGNQVFVPPFAAGGGFGIDELRRLRGACRAGPG